MIRQTIFIIILLGGYITLPVFAVGKRPVYQFLKESEVIWEDERLSGEVKNAPIINLIKELLRKEGSDWDVTGNINGTISVSFDHLTINESIKKIMRISRYNYTLLFEEQEPADSMKSHHINELTIYQEDQRIRFSKTAQPIPAPKQKKVKKMRKPGIGEPAVALPAPQAKEIKVRNTRRSAPSEEEISQIEKEMKAVADELLAEKIITQEEYNELIGEMERHNNGNNLDF